MKASGRTRQRLASVAVAAGLVVGAAGIASAATSGNSGNATTSTPTATAQQAPPSGTQAPRMDPSTLKNGPGETLLTGSTADSVTAAAKKAVPGGTIIRVETDAQGAAYEAHVQKSDGTQVTLKFDKDFQVTATQQGFGGPPPGPQGQHTP